MKTKVKVSYAGLGLVMGSAIAAALFIVLFALTGNPLFIPFIGAGSAIGLIIGAILDQTAQKGKVE